MYPKDNILLQRYLFIMLSAALLTIAWKSKQPSCQSTDEWRGKCSPFTQWSIIRMLWIMELRKLQVSGGARKQQFRLSSPRRPDAEDKCQPVCFHFLGVGFEYLDLCVSLEYPQTLVRGRGSGSRKIFQRGEYGRSYTLGCNRRRGSEMTLAARVAADSRVWQLWVRWWPGVAETRGGM